MENNSPQPPSFDSDSILRKYIDINDLEKYFDQLLKINKKINLVSRETSLEDLRIISADCLIPFEFISPPSGTFFDIGTGAGFPSIVILMAFSNLRGTIIERTRKKAGFVRSIVHQFDLKAEVLDYDLTEIFARLDTGSYDYGFMKLVRLDKNIMRMTDELLSDNGRFIYYSNFNAQRLAVPSSITIDQYSYYLNNDDNLKKVSIFSRNA